MQVDVTCFSFMNSLRSMSKTTLQRDPDSPDDFASEPPRLAPIEEPSSWKTRLVYALTNWQMGTVITPLKVAWARLPEGLRLVYEMNKLDDRLTLDPELHLLVKTFVATLNGCAFCRDIAMAEAPDEDLPPDKLDALLQYETASAFDDAERAALTYAEEATRDVAVADETFEALRTHFGEREIVEITYLVALENFYNRMNRPLGIGSDDLCEITLGNSS
jgi:alkylhydroperoxidase family enzyme